ncbi:hypothetical protein UFOVP376_23 [uncultured Caudovirales phage]|uniref:Uncharacterized protein n=1 Tax=uncultured Caudovirales phage TaxID=2100421 RepID=A0A6J7X3C0_9CAUD|nr:hypothetical protein UFOVP376_23 [uncultured Caudovirales phage]
MRVRLRLSPKQYWVVESKRWYDFDWQYKEDFYGDNAYERAKAYALRLKHPRIEEIT